MMSFRRIRPFVITTKLDFKFITWIEVKHGGVGLAHKQIAVALNFCGVAEFAATFADAGGASAGLHQHTTVSFSRCSVGTAPPRTPAVTVSCGISGNWDATYCKDPG